MKLEEIDRVARQRPFVPFEVRTADGKVWLLDQIERFFVSNRAIYLLDRRRNAVVLDIFLITSIRERTDLLGKRRNGARSGR